MRENNRYSGLEHVPTCSTWPPPWLASPPPAPAPRPNASPSDLSPDLYERWEERAAIMQYDGKIPLQTAEALALAEVLGQADPRAGKDDVKPTPETAAAVQPAPVIQASFFAAEKGPYV